MHSCSVLWNELRDFSVWNSHSLVHGVPTFYGPCVNRNPWHLSSPMEQIDSWRIPQETVASLPFSGTPQSRQMSWQVKNTSLYFRSWPESNLTDQQWGLDQDQQRTLHSSYFQPTSPETSSSVLSCEGEQPTSPQTSSSVLSCEQWAVSQQIVAMNQLQLLPNWTIPLFPLKIIANL